LSKAKWIMKQYWRVGTIRAISGVAMGMFVLGRYYYQFIPPLAELGFAGAIILGTVLFLLFLGFGYIYDARLKLWNERMQVEIEKNPYTFIPPIRYHYFEYPFYYAIIDSMKEISGKIGTDTTKIDELSVYLTDYFSRKPGNRSDLFGAYSKAENFRVVHPFIEDDELPPEKLSLSHRAKTNSMLNFWRWRWVQNFTGLPQDVMILAVFLGAIVYAEFLVDAKLPTEYLQISLTFFALPLFLLLLTVGWYYDKKLKLWAPDEVVKAERNPYSYVPDPKLITYSIPFNNALLNYFMQLFSKFNFDMTPLVKLETYLDTFSKLSAADDSDMATARQLRKDFGPVFTDLKKTEAE